MNKTHTAILYAALIVTIIYTVQIGINVSRSQSREGTWVCSNVVCTKAIDGQAWAQKNCFYAPTDNGSQAVVCKVVINNVNQLVPLSSLNLSSISQCVEYQCTQEVNVRPVNYTINTTAATQ